MILSNIMYNYNRNNIFQLILIHTEILHKRLIIHINPCLTNYSFKMKKKTLLITGSICFLMAIGVTMMGNDVLFSDTMLANVEAMASSGESSVSDTGPGEIVDCAGWGTGSKKECLSQNSNPCTPTQCK